MKSKHKALLLSICAVLLVAASVLGTFAYLTDTEAVTNTFTVGSVGLKLDEAKVKPDGFHVNGHDTRVQANEYHLIPGHTYFKDPTVTVDAGSEDAYVRMVVNVEHIDQLKLALPDAKYYADLDNDTFADDFDLRLLLDDSWNYDYWHFVKYSESGTTGTYEFRYRNRETGVNYVVKSEAATKLPDLFEKIKVPGEIDNTHLACLKDVRIVVNAHAIQADGFKNDEAGAWTAFDGQYATGSAGN